MLEDEALLVIERENGRISTEMSLLQLAVASILSKKAGNSFKQRMEKLVVDTKPRDSSAMQLSMPTDDEIEDE